MENEVADSRIQEIAEVAVELLTTYGLSVVGAVLILIAGWTIAGWAARAVRKVLSRTDRVDGMLRDFFASLVRYSIIVITVIAVLNQFGVETTSLIAVVGAAGLAIGLALQGTLSNLAAGVMLLLFRPFKVGDYVEVAGLSGTVKTVNLFVTELATPDNVQILAPNGQVWGAAVKNYSFHDTRRLDLTVGIDYGDDIGKAMNALNAVLAADGRVLKEPEPMTAVSNLGDSSVDILVRFWCQAPDYWALKFDMTRAFKEAMDREGISIPFPQTVIHQAKA